MRDSWLHPLNTPATDRRTRASAAFDLCLGIRKGFMALLLTQRFLKISARTPIRENRLMVLALCFCQRRLLLQQVAQQDRLLGISFLLVPQFLGLGVTDCFCHRKVRTRFPEMPKLR